MLQKKEKKQQGNWNSVSGKQLGLLCSAWACSLLKNDYPVATSSHGETECGMCSVRYAPEALWERK